jgi:hypothetical protein
MGCCGESVSGFSRQERAVTVPSLGQVYERHAEDYTRTAEQTDDPVFRNMLRARLRYNGHRPHRKQRSNQRAENI